MRILHCKEKGFSTTVLNISARNQLLDVAFVAFHFKFKLLLFTCLFRRIYCSFTVTFVEMISFV